MSYGRQIKPPVRMKTHFTLGYFGRSEDLGNKSAEACDRFGTAFVELTFAQNVAALSEDARACQRSVLAALNTLRGSIVERASSAAQSSIADACGETFDELGISSFGATVDNRVANLIALVINRSKNLALQVCPPNNIGSTAEFGPFPVGLTTFNAFDMSRQNVPETGTRPVTFDVYYPSTESSVADISEEVFAVLGIEILPAPVFRDTDLAPGKFPLVLFSHGFGGIRFQSFFHVAHLASHGFIVVSPDHHGNTIPDDFIDIVDTMTAVNRAADMKFLMDQILNDATESGARFTDAIDADRIGMSGHSYGGYEAFILTGGEVTGTALDETTVTLGTFTDPRIKAIIPMAPRTMRRVDAVTLSNSYFETVTVPTLVIGSELDMTDPFFVDAMRAFENLPSGASFVGLAEVLDGGHNTFADLCELQPTVLDLVGGADEGCMPRHLPFKHAHDLINYLSVNFFDATLNGNAEAFERLTPETVGAFEDLRFWRK